MVNSEQRTTHCKLRLELRFFDGLNAASAALFAEKLCFSDNRF